VLHSTGIAVTETDDSFLPPWWLKSPHVQSILQALALRGFAVERRAAPLLAASEPCIVDCGDGVRLMAKRARPGASAGGDGRAPSRVIVLHGWEGSSDSLQVLSLAQELFARGHEVIRLNFRDHGPTHHLNPALFHSCRLTEVIGAVRALQNELPAAPVALAGFSLGGNFALRVAADAPQAGIRLVHVFAVSPVLDPASTLEAMEAGTAFYERYFLGKWTRSLRAKQRAWPDAFDFSALRGLASLRAMTAALVRDHTDFGTLDRYLDGYALVGSRLAALAVPATLLTAGDDPIIPARDLARVARSSKLRVVVTPHGGHCGFLETLGGPSYADRLGCAALAPTDPGS
jgi:predicted alpha/beta-fold hydrolase